MRILLILTVGVATAWSIYWAAGSIALDAGTQAWFKARQTEGWTARYDDMKVQGFPNRLDTAYHGIELSDPKTGWGWTADHFQINALSYKPNHLIAIWPKTQQINTPMGRSRVDSHDMRASLVLASSLDLALDRFRFTTNDLSVPALSALSLDQLSLAVERQNGATYHIGLSAADVHLPAVLHNVVAQLNADVSATFNRTWDRNAFNAPYPQLAQIDIHMATAQWGDAELQIKGAFQVTPTGHPEGQVTLEAVKWQDILPLAQAAGLIDSQAVATLKATLGALAQAQGNPDNLALPLNFHNGTMRLGPLPIGPAPILTLR